MNAPNHESSTWTHYLNALTPDGRTEPVDPEKFRAGMRHDRFPRASAYDAVWAHRNHMGPSVLWFTEALTQVLPLEPGMRVLDLGCGSAISSIFLAREFGVQVWAADLWIDPSSNRERIDEAGVSDRVFPIEAEAHTLPFAHAFFDAIVSVDAYHYFGTDVRYLSYLAQFVRTGGYIGIVAPGNDIDPDDLSPEMQASRAVRRRLLHVPQRAVVGAALVTNVGGRGDARGDDRGRTRSLAATRARERSVGRDPVGGDRRRPVAALRARTALGFRAGCRPPNRRSHTDVRPRSLHDQARVTR